MTYFTPPTDGSKPYTTINADPITGEWNKNWEKELHDADIENLRGKEDSVSLDTSGFQFYRRAAKHTSFVNDEEIEQEYYPESIELVKKITGASRIVPFDHSAYSYMLMSM